MPSNFLKVSLLGSSLHGGRLVWLSVYPLHQAMKVQDFFFFFLVARTSLTTQHTWLVKDRWVAGLKILVSRHMTSQKGLAKISH